VCGLLSPTSSARETFLPRAFFVLFSERGHRQLLSSVNGLMRGLTIPSKTTWLFFILFGCLLLPLRPRVLHSSTESTALIIGEEDGICGHKESMHAQLNFDHGRSILSKNCDENCVAICVAGSIRTFFHPKVRHSFRDTLLKRFSPDGQHDVFLELSSETGTVKGGMFEGSATSRCHHLQDLKVVHSSLSTDDFNTKLRRCYDDVRRRERTFAKTYDWVAYVRPDYYWKRFNLSTKSPRLVYYRHDQFSFSPREHLDNAIYPFQKASYLAEVDVNLKNALISAQIFRVNDNLGKLYRYFEVVALYFSFELCPPCSRYDRTLPGAFHQAIRGNISLPVLRMAAANVMALACFRLHERFDSKDVDESLGAISFTALLNSMETRDQIQRDWRNVSEVLYGEINSGDAYEMPSLRKACIDGWPLGASVPNESRMAHWHPPGFAPTAIGELGEIDTPRLLILLALDCKETATCEQMANHMLNDVIFAIQSDGYLVSVVAVTNDHICEKSVQVGFENVFLDVSVWFRVFVRSELFGRDSSKYFPASEKDENKQSDPYLRFVMADIPSVLSSEEECECEFDIILKYEAPSPFPLLAEAIAQVGSREEGRVDLFWDPGTCQYIVGREAIAKLRSNYNRVGRDIVKSIESKPSFHMATANC